MRGLSLNKEHLCAAAPPLTRSARASVRRRPAVRRRRLGTARAWPRGRRAGADERPRDARAKLGAQRAPTPAPAPRRRGGPGSLAAVRVTPAAQDRRRTRGPPPYPPGDLSPCRRQKPPAALEIAPAPQQSVTPRLPGTAPPSRWTPLPTDVAAARGHAHPAPAQRPAGRNPLDYTLCEHLDELREHQMTQKAQLARDPLAQWGSSLQQHRFSFLVSRGRASSAERRVDDTHRKLIVFGRRCGAVEVRSARRSVSAPTRWPLCVHLPRRWAKTSVRGFVLRHQPRWSWVRISAGAVTPSPAGAAQPLTPAPYDVLLPVGTPTRASPNALQPGALKPSEAALEGAGSTGGQRSRVEVRKGPNGQDYEYEYVYYYYDDEEGGDADAKRPRPAPHDHPPQPPPPRPPRHPRPPRGASSAATAAGARGIRGRGARPPRPPRPARRGAAPPPPPRTQGQGRHANTTIDRSRSAAAAEAGRRPANAVNEVLPALRPSGGKVPCASWALGRSEESPEAAGTCPATAPAGAPPPPPPPAAATTTAPESTAPTTPAPEAPAFPPRPRATAPPRLKTTAPVVR
ncbi:Protein of unknown function [Gryllus bimaculatus]|nr:Protein of unknown function [Gryllus bimaculatus]